MTILAHQLTQHVAVPPTSTAQVQYPAALQTLWHHQTTAIVPEGRAKPILSVSAIILFFYMCKNM